MTYHVAKRISFIFKFMDSLNEINVYFLTNIKIWYDGVVLHKNHIFAMQHAIRIRFSPIDAEKWPAFLLNNDLSVTDPSL